MIGLLQHNDEEEDVESGTRMLPGRNIPRDGTFSSIHEILPHNDPNNDSVNEKDTMG
jgi:hypothetical protein